MYSEVCIKAPAKINLHLDILDKRPDGFHNLISLFQSISLYDTLHIRSLKRQNDYELKGNFNFPTRENIITKAVDSFRKHTGIDTGLAIEVHKELPQGAGLGGGSSDAAAALEGLNQLFAAGLSTSTLCRLGAELGSDVPFFLASACGLVSGRGEKVTPLHPRTDYNLLIICPDFHVNTAKAYSWLDDARRNKTAPRMFTTKQLKDQYLHKKLASWQLDNSFREVLCRRYQEYSEIFSNLKDSGAIYINISGSGSAIYGLFTENEKLDSAFRIFSGKYSFTRVAKPLDKRPSIVLN